MSNLAPFSLARNFFGFDPFEDVYRTARRVPARTADNFVARFDVKETEDAYLLSADLPGVKEEDIEVTVDGNELLVKGSRAREETKEGENFHLYERSFGAFTRRFSLPETANTEAVEASLKDGVLTLTVGKRAEAKPRKISLGSKVKAKLAAKLAG